MSSWRCISGPIRVEMVSAERVLPIMDPVIGESARRPRWRSAATTPATRWTWAADLLLAAAMAVSTFLTGYHHAEPPDRHGPFYVLNRIVPATPRDAALVLLITVPLALRRRLPLSSFWTVLIAAVTLGGNIVASDATLVAAYIACLIAAYSAAVYAPYRAAMAWSLVLGAALLAANRGNLAPNLTRGYSPFLVMVPIVLGANAVGNWRQRMRAMRAEQEVATVRAVEQERARIAAELHDVVTHNVSVMVIQAGAARSVLERSPDLVREALLAIEDSGRAAMSELRHAMGLLTMASPKADGDRDRDGYGDDLAPQPGLARVPALVEPIRSGGTPVRIETTGEPPPLPDGVSLAAYRVVQEALTNAVKHAAGSEITVRLGYEAGQVLVEVTNGCGTRSAGAAAGSGRGLAGLRQRLDVYGGTLNTTPTADGGFRVSAAIPVSTS